MMENTCSEDENSGEYSLKILLVDDTPANLKMMRSALEMYGHVVIEAFSGEEALTRFEQGHVDVVLMDVRMPGIGGIEATRRLRTMAGDRWLPVLFVSALCHNDDMVIGLEAGGDDYLAKPVNLVILMAKIRALQRIAAVHEKLRQANASLEAARTRSKWELELAGNVMDQMIKSISMESEGVELWIAPAEELSGDLLISRKGGDGSIYVLLADAMGHGLPAAIVVMPLIQIFSAMTTQGCSVSLIAREMNARLKAFLPTGNFVAVTLVKIDKTCHSIDIWNGGNPSALLVNEKGDIVRKFSSTHLALGILSVAEFDATSENCTWADTDYFKLFSDGLVDAQNQQGLAFGEENIYAALAERRIKSALLAHLDGAMAHDDVSLAKVDFSLLS